MALQLARVLERVDVLVTDLVLFSEAELPSPQERPPMHGIELMRRIIELKPNIKIILFSGQAQDVIATLGAVPPPGTVFLRKPFTVGTLVGSIKRLLGSQEQ